jgi:hypothetical protein
MHARIEILIFDDFPGEIDRLNAAAFVGHVDLEFIAVQREDNFHKLTGLALVAVIDGIVHRLANRQFQIFDAFGAEPERTPDLIGAGANDALKYRHRRDVHKDLLHGHIAPQRL